MVRQPLREVVASPEGRRPNPLHRQGGGGRDAVQEPGTELTPLGLMRFLRRFSGSPREQASCQTEMFVLTKLNLGVSRSMTMQKTAPASTMQEHQAEQHVDRASRIPVRPGITGHGMGRAVQGTGSSRPASRRSPSS